MSFLRIFVNLGQDLKLSYCSYELLPHVSLRSRITHHSRQGALLKVEFKDGLVGYADCHPWEEFGDKSLAQQLHLLGQSTTTPLTERSLYYARLDSQARSQKISLFDGLSIPESHFLIPNLLQWDPANISTALQQGFTRFKVKLGASLDLELTQLIQLIALFPSNEIKVRLDFNLKLTVDQFEKVIRVLRPWREFIDFFEDPIPYDTTQWTTWQKDGHFLACDYQSQQAITHSNAARVLVIKPAIQDESAYMNTIGPQRYVFTSYLDHPLGQLTAAYTAALSYKSFSGKVDICGLLSHKVYQTNKFSEQMPLKGPTFVPPHGTGFGFDSLLAKQKWKGV